ncbi:hypothetical protein QVD17_01431 [Tagetes erecta]|uniref:SAM domain-containing protein n=1 Tax=Tagetes erecta TaxID=13708 RepID=A0AAD8L4X0_TARER|nr:hypothetical protein QVD17_01431 [Tagetes erecta]
MGITIAKHRLEILKLARKSSGSHPMAKLVATINKTKRTLARYVRTWVHRDDSRSAMVVVKTSRSYSSRWKAAMVKRSNRLVKNKQAPATTLLITNGYRPVIESSGTNIFTCLDECKEDGVEYRENLYSDDEYDSRDRNGGGGYWCGRSVEEVKWDAMFQNLKPT